MCVCVSVCVCVCSTIKKCNHIDTRTYTRRHGEINKAEEVAITHAHEYKSCQYEKQADQHVVKFLTQTLLYPSGGH